VRKTKRKKRRTTKPGDGVDLKSKAIPELTPAPALTETGTGTKGMDAFSIKHQVKHYHQSYAKTVLHIMSEGGSIYSVARRIGCSRNTLYKWAERYEDFALALEVGRDMSRGWWEEMGQLNVWNKNFNSTLWMMNMSNRFGWTRFFVEGKGGGPAATPNLHKHDHKHLTINLKDMPTGKLRDLRRFLKDAVDANAEEEEEDEQADASVSARS